MRISFFAFTAALISNKRSPVTTTTRPVTQLMCRWITLLSSEQICLSDVILTPPNSLIQLSKDASFHPGYGDINNHVTNGDGFG